MRGSCSCSKGSDTSLPQTEAGIEISIEENGILTNSKTTSSPLVAIHLQFEGQTIQRVEKDDTCTISDIVISGCYRCSKGATVKVKCEAKSIPRIEGSDDQQRDSWHPFFLSKGSTQAAFHNVEKRRSDSNLTELLRRK